MMSQTTDQVIAIDFGGTKAIVACVDSQGRISNENRFAPSFSQGPDKVLEELAEAVQKQAQLVSQIGTIVMASAGPLDPSAGTWLNPTNMFTNGEHWGEVPVVSKLKELTGFDVRLENDAAAAVVGEGYFGEAKGCDNYMVITLGTGVGIGVVCNGELQRSGRGLHPEASHIFINSEDTSAPDGDGNNGTVEAYLSGKNFAQRMAKRLGRNSATGEELLELYASGDSTVKQGFDEYAYQMALAITSFVVLYSPEKIFFSGGFSKAFEVFRSPCLKHLEKMLSSRRVGIDLMPELLMSGLDEKGSLLGAAAVAYRDMNL